METTFKMVLPRTMRGNSCIDLNESNIQAVYRRKNQEIKKLGSDRIAPLTGLIIQVDNKPYRLIKIQREYIGTHPFTNIQQETADKNIIYWGIMAQCNDISDFVLYYQKEDATPCLLTSRNNES